MTKDEHGIDIEEDTALETAEDATSREEAREALDEVEAHLEKLRQELQAGEERRRAQEVENPDAHRDEEPYVGD